MRRWNGWGDDTFVYPLPKTAARFLKEVVGPGVAPGDATLEEVVARVPLSCLPEHPLVVTAPEDRLRHARGQSFPDWLALRSGRIDTFPDGVAYPATEEDVRTLLHYAKEIDARLIPYGGGTSVVGHVNPLPDDSPIITVDLGRLSRLLSFDETSKLATFGAGVRGPDLEAQLRARGCTLGHFPQSFEYSTLGGWIATRSSGQQSLRYGRIERLFAGGRVETPVGTLRLPANVPASAAGPDLRELVLGSEGRLGIITEATVRASPLPEEELFVALFFPSFAEGRAAVREMLQAGLPLAMLRLSTATETETTLAMAGHEFLISSLEKYLAIRGAGEDKSMLIVGLSGRKAMVDATREEALEITGAHGGVYVGETFGKVWHRSRFKSPYLRNSLWEAGYALDTLETAVDWATAPLLVRELERVLRTKLLVFDEFVHVFTHFSHLYPYGTSIYTTYLFRLASDPTETLKRWSLLKSAASDVIVKHGGTISHQHGVGVDHRPYLEHEKGNLGMSALQALVAHFDPAGIMNPGKLI